MSLGESGQEERLGLATVDSVVRPWKAADALEPARADQFCGRPLRTSSPSLRATYPWPVTWHWTKEPWQYRVLDALPSGVDNAQLDHALSLSPTERLQSVVDLMKVAEDLQHAMRASLSKRS